MSVESRQVKLRLTQDKEVLKQLKKNKAIYVDKDGAITYCTQYDSQCFYFKPGIPITFAKSVADALQRSNKVIVGDHLSGDFHNILFSMGEWNLGEREPDGKNPITTCNECGKDCGNRAALAKHILTHGEPDEETAGLAPRAARERAMRADIEGPKVPARTRRPEVSDAQIEEIGDKASGVVREKEVTLGAIDAASKGDENESEAFE